MRNHSFYTCTFGLLLFLFSTLDLQAQLKVLPDEENTIYQAGENMNFVVNPIGSGTIEYSIFYDKKSTPITTGTLNVSSGQEAYIPFTLNDPGFVFCEVKQFGQTDQTTAIFSPYEIQQAESEPSDFDAFWEDLKDDLASVAIDPQLEYLTEDQYKTTYRINLAQIDNRRVYGYISIPTGPGPFPAIVSFPSYGNVANLVSSEGFLAERGGAISLKISIHNVPPNQVDPNGYEPDIIDDPNQMYLRWAVLAGVRAIDYIFTRSDFDGENMGVTGLSQGGALSTMVAGIDDRVKLLAIAHPSHAEHAGLHYDKASGFPFYLKKSRDNFGTTEHELATLAATRYYDVINFAKRFDGPVLNHISYEDDISLAAGIFAAHNEFSGEKVLMHWLDNGHNPSPPEYWNGRFDFFRRHFPAMQTPPWPWPGTTLGYSIDAGDDQNVNGSTTNLNGSTDLNGQNNSFSEIEWKLISGPGNVNFTNENSYTTQASFSENGTYQLALIVQDEDNLSSTGKFYTLIDYINVTANGGGSNPILTLDCPSNISITAPTGATGSVVNWSQPNMSTTCPGGNVSLTQTGGSSSGNYFPEGTYTISYEAEDNCGNIETCSFQVTVEAGNASTLDIDCPNDVSVTAASGASSAEVNWVVPTANTNCPSNGLNMSQTTGLANGSSFPEGNTTITYEATDNCGNIKTCSFTITVNVDEPPTGPTDYCDAKGNQPWNQFINKVKLENINNTSFKESYGDFTNLSTDLNSSNSYSIELTAGYSWTTYDEYFKVWIDYNQDGVFQDPSEVALAEILSAPSNGTSTATLASNISIPSSALPGNTRMRIAMSPDGFQEPCGTFNLGEVEDYTINIIDNGNTPTTLNMVCPSNQTFTAEIGATSAVVSWNAPTTNTTCSSNVVDLIQTNGPSSGSVFNAGTTTISYEASDDCGNVESCSFEVIVIAGNTATLDILCPVSQIVTAGVGETSTVLSWNSPETSTDCPSNVVELIQTSGPSSGNVFNVGTTTVSYEASDDCGNVESCSFDITVIEGNAATLFLTCPASQTITLQNGATSAVLNWDLPSVSTDCPSNNILLNQESGPLLGSSNGVGTYTIAYEASDDCGNVETCSFTINVEALPNTGDYCTARAFVPWDEWIQQVTLEDIENFSDMEGYGDFTNVSTVLETNGNYSIYLRPGYSGNDFKEYWKIWIDFNQDGNFEEAEEIVKITGKNAQTVGFSVPSNAVLGTTRMRVTMRKTGYAQACGNYGRGEVEDYTIIIEDNSVPPSTGEYCDTEGEQPWQEWIQRVEFGEINNFSLKEGYGDFTYLVTDLNQGENYEINLTPGYSWLNNVESWRVWIDFNRDGDFYDSNELVLDASGIGKVNYSINIPNNVSVGPTRMRISMQNGEAPPPCSTFQYGEVEDYMVNILPASTSQTSAIEFLHFDVRRSGSQARLYWVSNSNHRDAYYQLERSVDNENFEIIATIENIDSGQTAIARDWQDVNPLIGKNYYRLLQVFNDGDTRYTEVKELDFDNDQTILVYPNPTSNWLSIDLSHFAGTSGEIQIYNNLGELMDHQKIANFTFVPLRMEVKEYLNGTYWIVIKREGRIWTEKFVKILR